MAEPSPSLPEFFHVAFSLAGEQRHLVRPIAQAVEGMLGKRTVFFDEWYEHYIAGLDADLVLQDIYRKRAVLTVACISERWGNMPWTQAEYSAIRDLQMSLAGAGEEGGRLRFLPIRVGDGEVRGVPSHAICPDVRQRTPEQAAQLIVNRLSLIEPPPDQPPVGQVNVCTVRRPIANTQHDTGTMDAENPWYVERKVDERVFRALTNESRTISIKGLPGSGTSSLVVRTAKRMRRRGYQEVAVDLKTDLRYAAFASPDAFFPALAGVVAQKLGRSEKSAREVASGEGLAQFINTLAASSGGRFLLTLDKFDDLFSKPASVAIQSHLRSFHNKTASAPLCHLRLILVHTIAPRLGDSPEGSVFDVAEKFVAEDLSLQEVRHLVSLYGQPLVEAEIKSLHDLLAEHPAFTRQALNYAVEENEAWSDFRDKVLADGGIFLASLRGLFNHFEKPPGRQHRKALARAMHKQKPCGSETDFEHLLSLGLIRGTYAGDALPRCLMFENWFSARLPKPRR